ncbi:MAG: hypothetical protein IKA50_03800 [Clostridia bacterium]|nr:hypothetical protein [Clostridia bacterium]
MSKNAKKVNPYEKKKKRQIKISRKQWTAIIALLSAIALIAGIIVAVNLGKSDEHYEGDGHDHSHDGNATGQSTNSDKVRYQLYTNADKTYRVVFRDANGKSVAEFDKIAKNPIKETIDANKGIYELGWATGDGPSDFECIYYNVKTGQVSEKFHAPRGTDGVRIAYGNEDETKIIVQDVFDKKNYYKEHALSNPSPNKNGYIIVGGTLKSDKKSVSISYYTEGQEDSQLVTIPLYA